MANHKHPIPDDVWHLAASQGGVISFAQLARLGVSRHVVRRAVDDNIWWPVTRGLYSTSPTPSWHGQAWAGLLMAGDGAVLGYEAAGHLHGWCDAPSTFDVLAPRRVRDRGPWAFHHTHAKGRGSLRSTLPERTAVDLCSRSTPEQVFGVLADAVTSRQTTAARILDEARRRPNLPNRGLIVEALGDVVGGVHSALEKRFRNHVEHAHGLQGLSRQVRVSPGEYTDVVLEDFRVVIELDGHLGHDGRHAFRDRRRDNRNARRGWTTLRYGWDDVVGNPCAVAKEIVDVLVTRGWQGTSKRCPRCLSGSK